MHHFLALPVMAVCAQNTSNLSNRITDDLGEWASESVWKVNFKLQK